MKLFQIFKKQGGMELVKRYLKGGALLVAIVEFMLLGREKTALEILRLAADYKVNRKLRKKYWGFMKSAEQRYDESLAHNHSDIVWVCWFQGIDNAPILVRRCYESLRENLSDRRIVLITEDNFNDYVLFPQHILDKWKDGQITHTHMTDLLRLELLIRYGGTWIDATVLCSAKREQIPDYFFDSDLFFYQSLKPGKDGLSAFISSWYLTACSNNKVLWLTRELCYEYWRCNSSQVDYYLFHDFMCMVLEAYPQLWKSVVPRDNGAPHSLLLRLFEQYDENQFSSIVNQSPFHKLSYKFSQEQMEMENTNYKIIIGD